MFMVFTWEGRILGLVPTPNIIMYFIQCLIYVQYTSNPTS